VIETLIKGKDFKLEIFRSHCLLVGLMRLVKDKRHSNGICPGLRLLSVMIAEMKWWRVDRCRRN